MPELQRQIEFTGSVQVRNYEGINELSGHVGKREAVILLTGAYARQITPPGKAAAALFTEWAHQNKENMTSDDFPTWCGKYTADWQNRRTAALSLASKNSMRDAEMFQLFGKDVDTASRSPAVARAIFGLSKGLMLGKKHFTLKLQEAGNSVEALVDSVITDEQRKSKVA